MNAILDQFGKPFAVSDEYRARIGQLQQRAVNLYRRQLAASYDAASEPIALTNYWTSADFLSPNSANKYTVRRKLRSRARYEVIENNPYLRGVILMICNDTIGTGPRLQVTDKRLKPDAQRKVENLYSRWVKATQYRQKLWQMRLAKCVDGEGFKKAFTDYGLTGTRHKLNFRVFEADQCSTEWLSIENPKAVLDASESEVDGIRLDENGQPAAYFVLDRHPGGSTFDTQAKGSWIPANRITHWFRKDRNWDRGIPEVTPSLALCALLRRYTLAVVKAAEAAADFSILLESQLPPNPMMAMPGNQVMDDLAFDTFPISQGQFSVLPWNYKANQLDAKQPTASYDEFVGSLLREICRPLLVPYGFAAGSSKDSNMASGVLDAHVYEGGIRQERVCCEECVLDPDLDMWLQEASLMGDYLPFRMTRAYMDEPLEHGWLWPKIWQGHTDPAKVIQSLEIAHDKGFITDRDVQETFYDRTLAEWQEAMREQLAFREEIGMPTSNEAEKNRISEKQVDKPEPAPVVAPRNGAPKRNGRAMADILD